MTIITSISISLFPVKTFHGIRPSKGGSNLPNQQYAIDESDTTNYGDGAKILGIDLDLTLFAFGRGGAGSLY